MADLPHLVLIEWQDSYCATGWQHISTLDAEPLVCRSVGWLVRESAECKVVAPHLSAEHSEAPLQGNGVMAIPTRAILSIVDLHVPVGTTCSFSAAPE